MAEQIRMNFDLMDEMAQAFGQGAQMLESVTGEVNNITTMLEDGGLIGEAGEALSTACRGPLISSITRLKDKFLELQKDINEAKDAMQSADSTASGYYG